MKNEQFFMSTGLQTNQSFIHSYFFLNTIIKKLLTSDLSDDDRTYKIEDPVSEFTVGNINYLSTYNN